MKKQVAYLQKLFYDLWNDFGSVYLIVNYSDRSRIGRRGFTEEEKKRGLVLVFNNKTNAELNWDADGNLSCVLAFGSRKEAVSIHHDDLRGLFSPDAKMQFLRSDMDEPSAAMQEPDDEQTPEKDSGQAAARQVISIDSFRKRRSREKE